MPVWLVYNCQQFGLALSLGIRSKLSMFQEKNDIGLFNSSKRNLVKPKILRFFGIVYFYF
jgi:hypothetical protein